MPRISLLRILAFIPLVWLSLIFTWLFLPSPQITHNDRGNYIQQTLQSGQIVTTVLDWPPPHGECAAYAIDWQLRPSRAKDSVTLHIGKARINLTDLVMQHTELYLSHPIEAGVRSGDLDHLINMPWFDYADASLFHHQMHGFTDDLRLRALVFPDSSEVQIWKDAASWLTFTDPSLLDDERRATGLLASFSQVQTVKGARANIGGIVVSDVWPLALQNLPSTFIHLGDHRTYIDDPPGTAGSCDLSGCLVYVGLHRPCRRGICSHRAGLLAYIWQTSVS